MTSQTAAAKYRLTVSNQPSAKPRFALVPASDAGALRDAMSRYANDRLVSGAAVIAERV